MSIATKTTRGLFWVSFSTIMIKIINFIITVILARLLDPEHFGLVAVGLILVNFFEVFHDFGIGAALIYKKDNIDKAANAAFFIFPAVATLFFIISYLIAPLAADFFNEPQVEDIIRALSFVFVIWSFGLLPNVLLAKDLEFKKQAIPQILPKIGYGIIAVWLAFNGFGVWSLVIGRIVLEVLSVLTVWPFVDWRPSFKFDRSTAYELIIYGKQVAGANLMVFIISILDVTFIGRFLGVEYVGYYSIALSITGLLTLQVSGIMRKVMFPIFSIMQDDKVNLKKAYLRTIKYVSLVSIPATFGIFIIASDFVIAVYSNKWLLAIAPIQILCFYSLNRSLLQSTENLYLARGKPEIRTKLNLVQLVLMLVLMYPLTVRYGILGTSIAAMLPSTVVVVLTFKEAAKLIEETSANIAKLFVPSITGSLLMVLAIYAFQYSSDLLSPVLRLSFSIILGSCVYIAFLWLTQKDMLYEIRGMMTRR